MDDKDPCAYWVAKYETLEQVHGDAVAELVKLKARVAELEAIKPLLDSEALDQARAVLEACDALNDSDLRNMMSDDFYAPTYCYDLAWAITAWRRAKEAK